MFPTIYEEVKTNVHQETASENQCPRKDREAASRRLGVEVYLLDKCTRLCEHKQLRTVVDAAAGAVTTDVQIEIHRWKKTQVCDANITRVHDGVCYLWYAHAACTYAQTRAGMHRNHFDYTFLSVSQEFNTHGSMRCRAERFIISNYES